MKIALVSRYFTLKQGGIGRVAMKLKEGLENRGHNVYTISLDDASQFKYLRWAFDGIKDVLPSNMDVYHAVTPMESICLPKDRTVVTVMDLIPILYPEKSGAQMQKNKVYQWVGKQVFTQAMKQAVKSKQIVTISNHVKIDVMNFGAPNGISRLIYPSPHVIRLGINSDLQPLPKPDNVFRIGYLGQLDPRKRVDLLIKAFYESRIDGELRIAGMGVQEEELKILAQGCPRVKFDGFVPDSELSTWFSKLDLLFSPTACEGYALTPVEAFACKKPVAVLADSIIPSDVKDRCFVCNCDSVGSLARQLVSLQRLISEGHFKNIEDNYQFAKLHDWNRTVEEYERVYQGVAR
jgi:glycosyltransferase involved in cell wall biosynthesis